MPYWDNYGVSKSQYDKGDFTKSTDRNVRNLATGKTGVSAAQLAAQNAAAKKKAEAKKKALEDAKHKTWLTNTKKKKKKKTDWVDKTLQTVDTVDKLYKFGTTLNPLNLYKTNPYILGGSLLKSLYDKNKKSKEKEKVSLVDVDTPIQVAELTESQKNWIDKELNNLKRGFKEPQHVYETINNPALGKFEKNTLNPFKGPQEPTTPKEFMDYLKEKAPDSNFPTVTAVGAEGGVARKKYYKGSNGILDLDETDGEEISLTAFNPNFDEIPQLTEEEQLQIDSEEKEPGEKRIDLFSETDEGDPLNELLLAEDGITSLFRAKNGGNASKNIKGQPHMLAYITPGEAKTLENLGGQKTMTKEGIPAYPPSENYGGSWGGSSNEDKGETSSDSGWSNNDWGSDQEDDVAQMEKDMGVTTDHSPDWTGSDQGWVVSEDEETEIGGSDYIGPKDKVRIHNEILNRKNTWDKDKWKRDAWTLINIPKTPFGLIPFAISQNKKKKERIAEIESELALLEKIGATKFTPHTDTIYQKLEQEKLDLLQPKKNEWDNKPDGDAYPVVPVHEEIQEYEEMAWDPMSYLDKIRAGQAQRASLQAKGIIQDNETMTLNSGGLANLFRVKNY
jgi:hypothetical protein